MTGQEIKEIRQSLCLTQEVFAKLIGTTDITIAVWETDEAAASQKYKQLLEGLRLAMKHPLSGKIGHYLGEWAYKGFAPMFLDLLTHRVREK